MTARTVEAAAVGASGVARSQGWHRVWRERRGRHAPAGARDCPRVTSQTHHTIHPYQRDLLLRGKETEGAVPLGRGVQH